MTINYVRKRSGEEVSFKAEKIENAVIKAARAVGNESEEIGKEVAREVISYLEIFFDDNGVPEVEQIQDLVEKVLIEKGYAEIAKAYILYREQHSKIRNTQNLFADAIDKVKDYLDRADWRVNENSNMSFSLQGLNNFVASEVTSQYWLQEVYSRQIRENHTSGDFHIHDLGNLSVYCCGWDLQDLLLKGFRGVKSKIESKPPKHFKVALGQIINFFYTLQGEAAGAQAFSNFDTYLAPFIYYDNLEYEEVKQCMQEFLFNINVPTRVGFQSPFTNVTMDLEVPEFLREHPVIIGGELQDKTYGEFQKEMDMLNRAFAEVMISGDAKGRMFSFPIPTYNITEDFAWDRPELDPVWEMTAKYGIPYFSNFINSDMDPEDARSMCLHPEEAIFIKKGNEIEKYKIGDLVTEFKGESIDSQWSKPNQEIKAMSLNPGTGKLEWTKIDKFLKTRDNRLVTIVAKDGKTMKVSADHLVGVYTKNGIEKKKAENLTEDDYLLIIQDSSNILNPDSEVSNKVNIDRRDLSNENIEFLRNADFTVVKVKDIVKEKLDYQQDFYDIELEKNHYFVHSDGNITHNCCRLRLDNRQLRKRGGGLFGANPLTGSIGVVTLNLPRIGYLADSKREYMDRIYHLMDLARDSLETKRKVLENLTEKGLYPYSQFYLNSVKERFDEYWKNHFNTIGINGMNESLLNFMGKSIASDEGRKFALNVMQAMKKRMVQYQEESDNLYNLEATPAEGTAYRLARLDKQKFGEDIICANEERVKKEGAEPYYTNSTHLPVGYTDDIFTALKLQDDLQSEYTGGTVFHGFLGERMPDIESTKKLVKRVSENFKLPYYTITPTFSICPIHGYLPGEHEYCPKCEAEAERDEV
ncbi:MAG: ribonucleoside triphosphate reductase [Halanaerobiales bacterium]